mmetsp:Transcript_25060/g.99665  ORF Transcript_25060/g.99665 Transcript_25060/m.99665 type:complete len:201 (+) Transcript_25060:285-887(+)
MVTTPKNDLVCAPDAATARSSSRQSRVRASARTAALDLRALGSSAQLGTARCQPAMPCFGRVDASSDAPAAAASVVVDDDPAAASPCCLAASLRARASCHFWSAISLLTWRSRRPARSRHAPKSRVCVAPCALPMDRSIAPKPPFPPSSRDGTRSARDVAGPTTPVETTGASHATTRGDSLGARTATPPRSPKTDSTVGR